MSGFKGLFMRRSAIDTGDVHLVLFYPFMASWLVTLLFSCIMPPYPFHDLVDDIIDQSAEESVGMPCES